MKEATMKLRNHANAGLPALISDTGNYIVRTQTAQASYCHYALTSDTTVSYYFMTAFTALVAFCLIQYFVTCKRMHSLHSF